MAGSVGSGYVPIVIEDLLVVDHDVPVDFDDEAPPDPEDCSWLCLRDVLVQEPCADGHMAIYRDEYVGGERNEP